MVISPIDFLVHIDKYLDIILQTYGVLVYPLLFIVVFLETGIVITPFLPGDSLIFVSGTFAARGVMNVFLLFFIFALAAIIGDTVNYWIGNVFGEKVFEKSRLFKKEYLEKTKEFYERHGGKTIIIARFIPIIRTFAPFVAGIGKMNYTRFLGFNVVGGIAWVLIFLLSGFFFGTMPFVQNNLSIIILIIIFISVLPAIVEYIRHRLRTSGK